MIIPINGKSIFRVFTKSETNPEKEINKSENSEKEKSRNEQENISLDEVKEELKDVASSTTQNEERNQEDFNTNSSGNSLIKKYNIAEKDLYKISYIGDQQSKVGFFKESLKQKI